MYLNYHTFVKVKVYSYNIEDLQWKTKGIGNKFECYSGLSREPISIRAVFIRVYSENDGEYCSQALLDHFFLAIPD